MKIMNAFKIQATPTLATQPLVTSSQAILPKPGAGSPIVESFIYQRHKSYLRLAKWCAAAYYTTRVVAGLSSALLPFVVASNHQLSVVLAIAVAVSVALDSIFKPREKWQLYSKATDLLATAEVKASGDYDKYKDLLDILMATESAKLDRLVDLKDLLKEVESAAGNRAGGTT